MSKRHTPNPEFEAKFAMEAISVRKMLHEDRRRSRHPPDSGEPVEETAA